MDNVVVMGSLYSHADLNGYADGLLHRKPCFLFNIFFEGNPFHQLHDDIVDAVFLPHIIHIYDIRVRKARRRLSFHSEFRYEICIFAELLFENLHGYHTV